MFYVLQELGNVQEGQIVLIHSAVGGCCIVGHRLC
jgi:hypothetical protein